MSIADGPVTTCTSELENDINDGVVISNDNNNDDNNVNDDASDDTSVDNSSEDASDYDDISASSATTPEDREQAAPWVSMVAMANENVANGINFNIVDSSPNDWLNLQSNYDLDAKGVYDNDESVNVSVYVA